MALRGQSIGVLGALAAFPLRLAAKRVASSGARLHRGATRRTTQVVVGRGLLARYEQPEIEARIAAVRAAGLPLLSEGGFIRLLEGVPSAAPADLSRQSLLDQSRLPETIFDHLALFDAFEHHVEPFSFRDLILARKYAGLLATGAGWIDIVRSVHALGPVASLTALTLQPGNQGRIVSRDAHSLAELDGQRLLPLDDPNEDSEDYFGLAETAEAAGLFAEAATLYRQCLALDPGDAVAAFNLGNCERAADDAEAAGHAYSMAIKRDSDFVEAWFNLGGLFRDQGKIDAARRHLRHAVDLDPAYADAIYNLGALDYDAGQLAAARAWWKRYLELDDGTDWARRARAGIALIDRQLRKVAG